MARPAFQQLQYEFAAHLRDPQNHAPPPGIEDRRLQIYRELFYNNIEDFLAHAFPVLRRISDDAVWHARVRDFFARHRARQPQFHQVAEEFLRFLDEGRGEHPDDPPFLRELCHYEWVELALSVSDFELPEQRPEAAGAAPADLLDGRPLVSPLAWMLAYEYPVHRIGPDFLPEAPPEAPTYLIVYRNRQDAVKFMEVNAVTARLMQLLEEDADSIGRALLQRIAAELQHPQPQAVIDAGAAILLDLRARDIVLGVRR